jgi:hypothetical protein
MGKSDAEVEALVKQVQLLQSRLDTAETRIKELEADPASAKRPSSAKGFRAAAMGSQKGSQKGSRPQSARGSSPMRTSGTMAKKPPSSFFTASMRGGPLTEPMKAGGLTQKEREDPESWLQGPSLLLRRQLTEQGFEMTAVVRAIERAKVLKQSNPEVRALHPNQPKSQPSPKVDRQPSLALALTLRLTLTRILSPCNQPCINDAQVDLGVIYTCMLGQESP